MEMKESCDYVYTLSFSGTACTRDEGEVTRPTSDKRIYSEKSGYIPVRIFKEVNGCLKESHNGINVRGSGENDWASPRDDSEPLLVDGPLNIPESLKEYVGKYSSGDQCSKVKQLEGKDIAALALHGANKAVSSGAKIINMIGHSRGAVSAIMAAWFIYAYYSQDIQINIFSIDPVPGPGEWWSNFTTLAPNVCYYAAVYSWDESNELTGDDFYTPVVPYTNDKMIRKEFVENSLSFWPLDDSLSFWPFTSEWMDLGSDVSTPDPLSPSSSSQPINYDLYVCPGRHSTLSGNMTTDSLYDPEKNSPNVANVGNLIYLMARTYLEKWGTLFTEPCAVTESVKDLRVALVENHEVFESMGGGKYRTSRLPDRPYVRRISSSSGINPWNKLYMEDVVGDPPYEQYYPVTAERSGSGWIKWNFL